MTHKDPETHDLQPDHDRVEEQTPMETILNLHHALKVAAADFRGLASGRHGVVERSARHAAEAFATGAENAIAEWPAPLSASRDHPTPEEQLWAAFRAGFEWASIGTDKYGEYNGGSIEDGFQQWARAPHPTPEEPCCDLKVAHSHVVIDGLGQIIRRDRSTPED